MNLTRSVLGEFSAVIITGGSSGIGRSFIELCGKLRPDLPICNLCRRAPDMPAMQLKLRHIACDLSNPAGQMRALAVIGWKNRLSAAFSSRMPKTLAARVAARLLRRWRLDRRAP